MNGGFDFDALRDPLAPEPGPRERAGVDARARQMNARTRRTRILLSATSLVAVAAIVFGVVALTRNPGPTITVENPSTTLPPTTTPTTYGPSNAGRFIPPTSTQNGLVVLPVTLPDGESFTMKYPPRMKIAQLGFAGTSYIDGRQVTISYTTVQHAFRDSDNPVRVYPGANGSRVFLFHANQQAGSVGSDAEVLAYQFGPWLAVVDAPPSKDTDPATLARSLSGTVDSNGYLVLHADRFAIGQGFEGGFGVAPGNSLQLAAHLYCNQPGSDTSTRRRATNTDGSQFVSWCDGDLHVSAGGTNAFLLLTKVLQVSPLAPPTGNAPAPASTTTTTTAPASNSPAALSSTWVSAQQGFVLEQSGTIAGTTDGGATWHNIGALTLRGDRQEKIRYIDPTDGFAFDPGQGALEITHDAGATWTNVDTPFTDVYDLAISRGMVYVVGMPPKSTGLLGIWSTPVEHLVWKPSPLTLQLGAGPVPYAQIVLQGGAGWITEVDRTVIAGTQLSANGQWVSWSPPCKAFGGTSWMTASTSTDLVAVCSPGVATPGSLATTTRIAVSHDAGATFAEQTVPDAKFGVGGPLSPGADTFLILDAGDIRRTTDGGATWHVVAGVDASEGESDFGFTTPTQGFVILGRGTMLMTYDAGASWQKVTLP